MKGIPKCKKINTSACDKCYKVNLVYYNKWLSKPKITKIDGATMIGNPLDPRMVFCQKFFPDRFTEEGGC